MERREKYSKVIFWHCPVTTQTFLWSQLTLINTYINIYIYIYIYWVLLFIFFCLFVFQRTLNRKSYKRETWIHSDDAFWAVFSLPSNSKSSELIKFQSYTAPVWKVFMNTFSNLFSKSLSFSRLTFLEVLFTYIFIL